MKSDSIVCRCNSNDIFLRNKGCQIGAYCSFCGKWIKWVNKSEVKVMQSNGFVVLQDGAVVASEQPKMQPSLDNKLGVWQSVETVVESKPAVVKDIVFKHINGEALKFNYFEKMLVIENAKGVILGTYEVEIV